MAITKSIEVRGVVLPSAYIRLDRITGGKHAGFNGEAGIYASSSASLPIDTVGLSFGFVADQDLLVTGYDALKCLPEFAGAEDC